MILKKAIKNIEPKGVFVYFNNVIPVFARTNTPQKTWNEKKRCRTLPNGDKYILPPYNVMKGHFVLLHDWPILCKIDKSRKSYVIPKGMSTDFASIPKFLHSLISPLSNSVYSAVLHDYLYRNPKEVTAKETSRLEADRIFYFGMKACGVKRIIALIMFWGVRIGGKNSYIR